MSASYSLHKHSECWPLARTISKGTKQQRAACMHALCSCIVLLSKGLCLLLLCLLLTSARCSVQHHIRVHAGIHGHACTSIERQHPGEKTCAQLLDRVQEWQVGCAPCKGVVAGARCTIRVYLQVLESERCLDIISSQRCQSAPQRVPCMRAWLSPAFIACPETAVMVIILRYSRCQVLLLRARECSVALQQLCDSFWN